MIKKNQNRHLLVLMLSAVTVTVIGCAAPMMSTSESDMSTVPTQSDPEKIGEIVVTGSRASRESRASSRNRDQPKRSMLNIASAPSCQPGITFGGCVDDLAYVGGEEIWVIQKPNASDAAVPTDEPGSGLMLTTVDAKNVALPLRHTHVTAQINGYLSTVNVLQEFSNPYDSKIEAVYLFPLPEKAAITEFLMVIGDRRIRGILREKEEAKEIYEAARSQGYRASLLVQHRPNIFEQKVANIEPGKSIDISIKYFHTLAYDDGWYSFVFPTVVGPRYNPPGSGDTSPAVQYLRPTERSAHDITISVDIDAGVKIEELRSTHKIAARQPDEQRAVVELANQSTMPNRDFVLNFKVAGQTLKSNLLTYVDPDSQQGYFTMMLYPPEETNLLARQNMEMVFVIDASGSMSGTPIEQAKDAVSAALDRLHEGDTFQIIRFSDNASQFGRTPVPATEQNLLRARQYLANFDGGGGTRMIAGIRAALDFPHDPSRLRFVSFLTDGYIGNESEILGEVATRLDASRIFSFGVGSSVNRYLMERLAKVGRGAVAYLGPQDSGYDVMDGFFNRVSHPALTDVAIDWNGMAVSDVYPSAFPDIFVGRPIVVTGKFLGAASNVTVQGRYGNADRRIVVGSDGANSSAPSLAKIWARMRIADLADRQTWMADPHAEIANEIKATALQHQLISDYTSFVAVDGTQRTAGDHGTTVHQAVPVPAGVRYETTVEHN